MIIKSMSRKTMSFGQLLRYIDGPEVKGDRLLHNFGASDSPLEIRQELIRNAHLLPPRKNGNVLFHEVLSFAEADREGVNLAVLTDLTLRYLELRAPYALGYARAHLDTANPHVHVLLSANDLGSSHRLRLPKATFRKIQLEMERYQQERYPELARSIAQAPRQVPEKRAEQERRRRDARTPSRKEEIQTLIAAELERSLSGEECYRRLQENGLRLYRRGQTVGVEDSTGRRYRLRTLGLADTFDQALAKWRQVPKYLKALEELQRERTGLARDGPEHQR